MYIIILCIYIYHFFSKKTFLYQVFKAHVQINNLWNIFLKMHDESQKKKRLKDLLYYFFFKFKFSYMKYFVENKVTIFRLFFLKYKKVYYIFFSTE